MISESFNPVWIRGVLFGTRIIYNIGSADLDTGTAGRYITLMPRGGAAR